MIRGTIEVNSNKEKVFLPELDCDIFIGILKPNQATIDKDGYLVINDTVKKDGSIAYADLDYYNKTCSVID